MKRGRKERGTEGGVSERSDARERLGLGDQSVDPVIGKGSGATELVVLRDTVNAVEFDARLSIKRIGHGDLAIQQVVAAFSYTLLLAHSS